MDSPSPEGGPTEQDIRNARLRQETAARQEAEYDACLALAQKAFGPGWIPSHRHYLVEKCEEEREVNRRKGTGGSHGLHGQECRGPRPALHRLGGHGWPTRTAILSAGPATSCI